MGVLNASPMRQSPAHQSTVTVLPVTPTQPVHHHQSHQHHHQSPQQQRHQSQSDAHGPQRVTAQNWDREPSATPSDATPETPEPPRTRRRDSRCNALTEQRSLTGAIRNTRSANGHASTSAEPQPRRKNTMDERERKRMLEEDEWTGSVETHSVVCMGCKRKVSLDKRSRYYPGLWTKHRGKCMEIKRLMAVKNAPSGEVSAAVIPYWVTIYDRRRLTRTEYSPRGFFSRHSDQRKGTRHRGDGPLLHAPRRASRINRTSKEAPLGDPTLINCPAMTAQ